MHKEFSILYFKNKFFIGTLRKNQPIIAIRALFEQEISESIDNRFPFIKLDWLDTMCMTTNYGLYT